jgi:rRNA maturation protein Nop10
MKLRKCVKCGKYTLKQEHCSQKTKEAGYKFVKLQLN